MKRVVVVGGGNRILGVVVLFVIGMSCLRTIEESM